MAPDHVAEHRPHRLGALDRVGHRGHRARLDGPAGAHEPGELLDDLGRRADPRLLAAQREPVAAQGDREGQPPLELAQHPVLLAGELDGDAVVQLDDALGALGGPDRAHMPSESRVPPRMCQCRWKTLWRASGPWLVVTR